jgi:hypothetical protein
MGLSHEQVLQTVADSLALEWQRKNSLEQRGITVITTSGVLVTLVFAGTTLVSQGKQYASLVRHESEPIVVALSLFIVAAVLGLVCNLPMLYRFIRARSLREVFDLPAQSRSGELLRFELDVLRTARFWNSFKSWALALALASEIGAVVFLVIAVTYIVENS